MTISIDIAPADSALVASLLGDLRAFLSISFLEHDDRLKACLSAAIRRVEQWTGHYIAPTTATVQLSGMPADFRVPISPIWEVTSAKIDGVSVSVTPYSGGYVRALEAGEVLELVIRTGYDSPPDDLREAILTLAASTFDGVVRDWKLWCKTYRTITWAS